MNKPNKTYRVELESTVPVDVEVDARNEEEAREKAERWCCYRSGQHPVKEYWVIEENGGGLVNDDTDLYYEITDVGDHKVVSVEVVEDDSTDSTADNEPGEKS